MSMRVAIAIGFLLLGLLSCGKELSPEDQQHVADLRKEQEVLAKEIAAADAEAERYTGGLILASIKSRAEIYRTSAALVQQRILAIESGAPVTVQTEAAQPDPARAESLLEDIAKQKQELSAAQAESDKYSGGLVKAMHLSAVATHAQTLAMLRQAHITAKYGLRTVALPAAMAAEPPASSALRAATPIPESDDGDLAEEVISVKLLRKTYSDQDFQDYLFFDIEFTATGLDKPARAIKGRLNLNDLFGELKLGIGWTIDKTIKPGVSYTEKGSGFEYNKFMSEHQWARSTELSDMTASFTVKSILYEDGTRRDF